MAYVAISKSLIEDVKSKLARMADAEKSTLVEPSKAFDKVNKAVLTELVLTELWKPEADLRDRLSKYGQEKNIGVKVFFPVEGDTPQHWSAHVELDRFPCIVQTSYYNTPNVEIQADKHEIFAEFTESWALWRECIDRWAKVHNNVIGFLEKCKSANEAVKLWPDVVKYFDKEILNRLDAKHEKVKVESEAAKALAGIDMDALKTSEVLARMAGSTL